MGNNATGVAGSQAGTRERFTFAKVPNAKERAEMSVVERLPKTCNLVLRDGQLSFVRVPAMMFADPKLHSTDIRVAGIMIPWLGDRETAWVSIGTIGKGAGICERRVRSCLASLVSAGWIEFVASTDNKTGRRFVALWRTPDGLANLKARLEGTEQDVIPSDEMPAPIQNINRPDYYAYLKTRQWDAKRRAALKRAKHRCQLCNSNSPLRVHHRTYERLGFELPSDLTVLCVPCHSKFHDVMAPAPPA